MLPLENRDGVFAPDKGTNIAGSSIELAPNPSIENFLARFRLGINEFYPPERYPEIPLKILGEGNIINLLTSSGIIGPVRKVTNHDLRRQLEYAGILHVSLPSRSGKRHIEREDGLTVFATMAFDLYNLGNSLNGEDDHSREIRVMCDERLKTLGPDHPITRAFERQKKLCFSTEKNEGVWDNRQRRDDVSSLDLLVFSKKSLDAMRNVSRKDVNKALQNYHIPDKGDIFVPISPESYSKGLIGFATYLLSPDNPPRNIEEITIPEAWGALHNLVVTLLKGEVSGRTNADVMDELIQKVLDKRNAKQNQGSAEDIGNI